MRRPVLSGCFLPGARGAVFLTIHRPCGPARGCVLVVPPFAEEMNKCRRMVAELSWRLAASGIGTVIPDLYGTGDSAGDFAEGNWACWQEDIARCCAWCRQQGNPITGILALRLGCVLAVSDDVMNASRPLAQSVFWQPVFDGAKALNQFLRLRVAASMMQDGPKENLNDLHARLRGGETIEVAGYGLSQRLAAQVGALSTPDRLPCGLGAIHWMEVVSESAAALPAPSLKAVERTRAAGGCVQTYSFVGEPFWAATEIVVNREMIASTAAIFAMAQDGAAS